MREAGLTADSMEGARSKEQVVSVRSVRGLTPPPSVFHCVAEAPWLGFFFFFAGVSVLGRHVEGVRRTTVPLCCGSAFVGGSFLPFQGGVVGGGRGDALTSLRSYDHRW